MCENTEKCDICNWEMKKSELTDMDGWLVCPDCKDEMDKCFWCEEYCPKDQLIKTDRGYLCENDFDYLISCGEKIVRIYNNDE